MVDHVDAQTQTPNRNRRWFLTAAGVAGGAMVGAHVIKQLGFSPPLIKETQSTPSPVPSPETSQMLPKDVLFYKTNVAANVRMSPGTQNIPIIEVLPINEVIEGSQETHTQTQDGHEWQTIITNRLKRGYIACELISLYKPSLPPSPSETQQFSHLPTPSLKKLSPMPSLESVDEFYNQRFKNDPHSLALKNSLNIKNTPMSSETVTKIKEILMSYGINEALIDTILSTHYWTILKPNTHEGGGFTTRNNQIITTYGFQHEAMVHEFAHVFYGHNFDFEVQSYGLPERAIRLVYWCDTVSRMDPQAYPEYAEFITYIQNLVKTAYHPDFETTKNLLKQKRSNFSPEELIRLLDYSELFGSISSYCMGHATGIRRMPRGMWNDCFSGLFTGKPDYSQKPYYV